MDNVNRDIFICHSSDDKISVVYPLVESLQSKNISCWLDEVEITLGESIPELVNEGIKNTELVVVVFSRSFLRKNWPKRELWSVLNKEASSGKNVVLPIMVGSPTEIEAIVDEFPLLADKQFLIWDGNSRLAANLIESSLFKIRGTDMPEFPRMLTCGECQTPFVLGVHVCLGCKGTIVYGVTSYEREHTQKISIMISTLFMCFVMIFLPEIISSNFDVKIPIGWGLGTSAIAGGVVFIVLATIIVDFFYVRAGASQIRTFR